MSADNQQERRGFYIAGYVDGEGSFHVAIQRNPSSRFGYQLVPEFRVSQHSDRIEILKMIQAQLACGYIKENHRNSIDITKVFVVRNRKDLVTKVIPFFQRYRILSAKEADFQKFTSIVLTLNSNRFCDKETFIDLLQKAFSMNRNGKYRKWNVRMVIDNLESSETTCQNLEKGKI